jgi:molecular chaperone DnaJ
MKIQMSCGACKGAGFQVHNPCSSCSGQCTISETKKIRINIPTGVSNGNQIRLEGLGSESLDGGHPGDVYIIIRIDEDDYFDRDGSDIHVRELINFSQAALGDSIKVKTIDSIVNLEIPPGTQPGTSFRLAGSGLPIDIGGTRRGDHYVNIGVEIPTRFSKKEKELIKNLRDIWAKKT